MKYLVLGFLLLTVNFCYSQVPAENIDKQIVNIYADTTRENNFLHDKETTALSTIAHSGYYLVKIYPQMDSIFRRLYKMIIVRRFDKYWYAIHLNNTDNIHAAGSYFQYILSANNNWKLSPSLISKKDKISSKSQYNFLIKVSDKNIFRSFINQHTAAVKLIKANEDVRLFIIHTNISFIRDSILPLNVVLNIDIRDVSPKPETVIDDYIIDVNKINLFQASYPGVDANGMTVSLKENLFDTTDIDFKGRIKPTSISSSQTDEHATIMGTYIGGGGNSFFRGKGIAPGVLLSSSDFAFLMPDGDAAYQQYDISVQNHSYGVDLESYYGSDAAAYDSSILSNPSLLHIFSAGNSGTSTPFDGQYSGIAGFSNLTGNFKMAKNILTVGAIDTFYNVMYFSSRGPAYDGRVKPELVAYGNPGSSDASAITSGCSLALQDAYRQQHGNNLPPNILVKTILINSADDVGRKGIDFFSGYGNVNLYRAVNDILSGRYFTESIQQDETKDFTINIPAGIKNLKITLAWNDVPALTNAPVALVNDLDLSLQNNATAETWLPWVLNSYPNKDSLVQLPVQKRDSLNVVEQITLDAPAQGNYTIHVKGYDVPEGPQPFYIAYRWDTANTFTFTSPARNDHFTSGEKNIFRWENNYSAATGKLEYSIDKGNTWNLIDANIDLSKSYYQWNTPDIFSLALARMTIGGDIYVSDTFNFSKQLYPKVGFNCTDSFNIYWNKSLPLTGYQLYYLGDKYLQPLKAYSDTFAVLQKNNNPSLYYAVAPVFENGANGVNSYTFDYTLQGVGCYIENFLADLQPGNSVLLTLILGSLHNVDMISFQKLTQSGWKDLQTIQPVTSLNSNYTDNSLNNGANTYRAIIVLKGGALITSAEITIYNFSQDQFILLPNPVQRNQGITILSDDPSDATLLMYDMMGRKVMQQQITNSPQTVRVGNLAKGIYFVVIARDGKKVFTKKIVIQ